MQHTFDIDIASRYGLLEAVLLNHFEFWYAKNKANNTNYYDGDYWTYNSISAYGEMFPYASEWQIRRALKKLEKCELIKTGNYNKSSYDRTIWYALTEKAISILQKNKMEVDDMQNGNSITTTPIPYNNTDIYNSLVEQWNSICISRPKVLKLDAKRKKQLKMRLDECDYDTILLAFDKIERSDFLSGRDGKWNNCTFDWLFKNSNNIIKVIEGNYDNAPDDLQRAYERLEEERHAGVGDAI